MSSKIIVSASGKEVPVVTFANGTVKASRKRKLTVSALYDASHKGPGKRKKMMGAWRQPMHQFDVVVDSGKMTYRGDNYGPLSVADQSTQLYIAKVNRVTGQMTMFPAERFQLNPVTQVDMQREQLEVQSMSSSEKSDLLTDAFGSRRQKRAAVRRQKNRLEQNAVTSAMGSAVDMALASHHKQPVAESQETSSAIPPYNKGAQTPAQVYSLADILGPADMDSLTHAAQVLKNYTTDTLREWTDNKEYPESVLGRLGAMPLVAAQRQEKACLLLYLHYMITLFHLKPDDIRRRDPLPQQWPDPIKLLLLDRFTVLVEGSHKRYIPARLKDLLLSHILVLCLIVDGFTTPLADLIRDLKISVNKLHNHVRALGCRVKTKSSNKDVSGMKISSSVAVLTVPLVFPEPFKKRKN